MSGWAAKRFWKAASVVATDGGFAVELDGRRVRTPAKSALLLPTQAMALAVAAEWDAQEAMLDPRTMPVTRSANAALDKVRPQRTEVIALIAAYGGSDLICYRAPGPVELVARQAMTWDPWLGWAAGELGADLVTTSGVMPVPQQATALARMQAAVAEFDDFGLAALHDLVGMTGSLVLGLAVAAGALTARAAWDASRVDEDWQREQWGADEDADALAAQKAADLIHAERFLWLARGRG
jgi:chaperone required for assembly of F1-ATPase